MRRTVSVLLTLALLGAPALASAPTVSSAPTSATTQTTPTSTQGTETIVTTSSGQGFPWGLLGLLGLLGLAGRQAPREKVSRRVPASEQWQLGGKPAPTPPAASPQPAPTVAVAEVQPHPEPSDHDLAHGEPDWDTYDDSAVWQDDAYDEEWEEPTAHGRTVTHTQTIRTVTPFEDPADEDPHPQQDFRHTPQRQSGDLEKPSERLAKRQTAAGGPDLSKPPGQR